MKFSQLFSMIFLSVLLASCMSNVAQAPQGWPEAVKAHGNNACINLNGLYINKAIEAPDNVDRKVNEEKASWAIYLSELLIPYIPTREFVEHKWANTIELKGVANDQLEITMRKNNKQLYHAVLNNKHDFTCSPEHLILRDHYRPSNMMGISEGFKTIEFSKGSDGSILGKIQEVEWGTITLIPYGGKKVQRYLFLPVDSKK